MSISHPLIDNQPSLELFQKIAEFNLYLVRYIDSSWLTTVKLSPLVNQIRQGGNADFHLSHYLLRQFSLHEEFDYEFDQPVKRIALIETEILLDVALYIGIILNEGVIRNAVLKKDRQALERCLGTDAYRFAVKKAQFVSRTASQQEPSLLIDWNHLERFHDYLQKSGMQVLGTAFSLLSPAFRKRVELKFSSDQKDVLNETGDHKLSVEECENLVLKAHREVNKEWRHLLS